MKMIIEDDGNGAWSLTLEKDVSYRELIICHQGFSELRVLVKQLELTAQKLKRQSDKQVKVDYLKLTGLSE